LEVTTIIAIADAQPACALSEPISWLLVATLVVIVEEEGFRLFGAKEEVIAQ
jgi:hypothetical protein